ncbi:hypothetical protein PJI16_04490 [Nitrospira sp. MA-1]|nr:hypothetical protein [Nitrospira sp. MA-1]
MLTSSSASPAISNRIEVETGSSDVTSKLFCPWTHELESDTGDNEGLKFVGTKIPDEIENVLFGLSLIPARQWALRKTHGGEDRQTHGPSKKPKSNFVNFSDHGQISFY